MYMVFNLFITLFAFLIVIIITTTIAALIKENNVRNTRKIFNKENQWIIAGFIIAILGVTFPGVILLSIEERLSIELFKEIGTIGDFFGGTMVGLLSLASMLFVTAAVVMQKEELKLQREELTKTRSEFEITNETMKKQAFDSTYFNLISLQKEILSEIKIEKLTGREAISHLFLVLQDNIFKNRYTEIKRYIDTKGEKIIKEILDTKRLADSLTFEQYQHLTEANKYFKIRDIPDRKEESREHLENIIFFFKKNEVQLGSMFKANILVNEDRAWRVSTYEEFYKDKENDIGHYYRNLYRIVKYIVESNLSFESQQTYIGILRAQLSADELKMLYYNIYYSNKGRKFYNLLNDTKIDFFQEHLNELEFEFKEPIK